MLECLKTVSYRNLMLQKLSTAFASISTLQKRLSCWVSTKLVKAAYTRYEKQKANDLEFLYCPAKPPAAAQNRKPRLKRRRGLSATCGGLHPPFKFPAKFQCNQGFWRGYATLPFSGSCRHLSAGYGFQMLNPMGIAAEMGVDPRLPQPLGRLPDPLAIAARKAPQVSLEGAAQFAQIVQKAI